VTAAFVAGLLAEYGIALPVGAVATYFVTLTARTSLRIGSAAALGIATADGLYALAATVGGWTLGGVDQAGCGTVARGAWTGAPGHRGPWRFSSCPRLSGIHDRPGEGVAPIGSLRAYFSLLGITILNPTTIVYFAACYFLPVVARLSGVWSLGGEGD
jgi:threonine/homoserine/homoserine lactone efflux protein